MRKLIVMAIFVALVLVVGSTVSAQDTTTGNSNHSSYRRAATRTPKPRATATYTPGPRYTPTPNPSEAQRELETVNLLNQRRAALGLQTFRIDPALTASAHRHSYDIGPRGLCQHNGTDGSSPW